MICTMHCDVKEANGDHRVINLVANTIEIEEGRHIAMRGEPTRPLLKWRAKINETLYGTRRSNPAKVVECAGKSADWLEETPGDWRERSKTQKELEVQNDTQSQGTLLIDYEDKSESGQSTPHSIKGADLYPGEDTQSDSEQREAQIIEAENTQFEDELKQDLNLEDMCRNVEGTKREKEARNGGDVIKTQLRTTPRVKQEVHTPLTESLGSVRKKREHNVESWTAKAKAHSSDDQSLGRRL